MKYRDPRRCHRTMRRTSSAWGLEKEFASWADQSGQTNQGPQNWADYYSKQQHTLYLLHIIITPNIYTIKSIYYIYYYINNKLSLLFILCMAVLDNIPQLNRNFHTYGMCHIEMTPISRPLVFTWEKKKVDWYFIVKTPGKIHLVH